MEKPPARRLTVIAAAYSKLCVRPKYSWYWGAPSDQSTFPMFTCGRIERVVDRWDVIDDCNRVASSVSMHSFMCLKKTSTTVSFTNLRQIIILNPHIQIIACCMAVASWCDSGTDGYKAVCVQQQNKLIFLGERQQFLLTCQSSKVDGGRRTDPCWY